MSSVSELLTLEDDINLVSGVALSGDGRLAVSACADKTLRVWDLSAGSKLRTLGGHSHVINGVALTCDGRLAASAS